MEFNNNVRLGAQLYINPGDPPQRIRDWVGQMNEAGLKLIRVFLNRSEIERVPDRYDFTLYDPCFDEAARCGLKVIATLSPATAPGYMRLTSASQDLANIDDPTIWDCAMAYVRETVKHYAAHPALDSWILWNEPSRVAASNPYAKNAWASFLEERYLGEIDQLNHLYYQQYSSFDELADEPLDMDSIKLDFQGYAEQSDRDRFAVNELNRKLTDIRINIEIVDQAHPIHINPHNVANGSARGGQSIFQEAEIVDFLGCSAHPVWHSIRFGRERYDHSIAMYCNLMASATKAERRYFWVTELQGGTTLYSSMDYYCPSPKRISHWIWESIGSGAKAVVFWCFNARDSGNEGGEWCLLNQAGRPSGRLLAVKEAANILGKNKELFEQTEPPKPEIFILFSQNTFIINELDQKGNEKKDNPRNRFMGSDAVCGAYLMCTDLGYQVGFVDEKAVCAGLPKNAILIAPSCTSLETETLEAIQRHVENGGTLIADGLFGYKDGNGFISEKNGRVCKSIFGAEVEDIEAIEENSLRYADIPAWFARVLVENPPQPIIVYQDYSPAVFQNQLGAGKAIRVTTLFFQRYFAYEEDICLPLMESLLADRINQRIRLCNPSRILRIHRLKANDFDIVVLLNQSTPVIAQLQIHGAVTITSLISGKAYEAAGTDYHIQLEANQIEVLYIR